MVIQEKNAIHGVRQVYNINQPSEDPLSVLELKSVAGKQEFVRLMKRTTKQHIND